MIPYAKLTLKSKRATVQNAGLPTEKHGSDERKAFVDLKVEVLLDEAELIAMLASDVQPNPLQYIFDYAHTGKPLALPDFDVVADLRDKISGDLTIKVGRKEINFGDAHTVGSTNKLRFLHGAQGRLTLNFRIDPGPTAFPLIREAVERAECVLDFEEYDESVSQKRNEQQREMIV